MAQGRSYEVEWYKEKELMKERFEFYVDALEIKHALENRGENPKMFVVEGEERREYVP